MTSPDGTSGDGGDLDGPTVAVVLAAGGGTRFAGPRHKLLVELDGRPLVLHAVDAAVAAGLDGGVMVVEGAVPLASLLPVDVVVVRNDRWAQGQATSLAAAVDRADAAGASAIVVGLGDQPRISPSAWRAVAASRSPIAVATYGGRRRNPVRLAREVWPLLPRRGDEGARVLLRERPELVEAVACAGDPRDVDHEEDLHRWS